MEQKEECCKGCGEPVHTSEGDLGMNDEGYCEACVEAEEYAKAMDKHDKDCDFDYSMNG